jgi:hypothetical protein
MRRGDKKAIHPMVRNTRAGILSKMPPVENIGLSLPEKKRIGNHSNSIPSETTRI